MGSLLLCVCCFCFKRTDKLGSVIAARARTKTLATMLIIMMMMMMVAAAAAATAVAMMMTAGRLAQLKQLECPFACVCVRLCCGKLAQVARHRPRRPRAVVRVGLRARARVGQPQAALAWAWHLWSFIGIGSNCTSKQSAASC